MRSGGRAKLMSFSDRPEYLTNPQRSRRLRALLDYGAPSRALRDRCPGEGRPCAGPMTGPTRSSSLKPHRRPWQAQTAPQSDSPTQAHAPERQPCSIVSAKPPSVVDSAARSVTDLKCGSIQDRWSKLSQATDCRFRPFGAPSAFGRREHPSVSATDACGRAATLRLLKQR